MTGQRIGTTSRSVTVAVSILLMLALVLPVLSFAGSPLPPRVPTEPPSPKPDGSIIQLVVKFPESFSSDWQTLWTVVQWQDPEGTWHDVIGWQGTLDKVQSGVGVKEWWVLQPDLGKGPFRWQVCQEQGGPVVATSVPFNLPDEAGLTGSAAVLLVQ